jgi:hypothetical protein
MISGLYLKDVRKKYKVKEVGEGRKKEKTKSCHFTVSLHSPNVTSKATGHQYTSLCVNQ